ncbi:hypothetical protein EV363DRAFT_1394862 [Boletus edulis]|nr:hypothetical protein EV363DRAFT_1394862 [Boletus edulis]
MLKLLIPVLLAGPVSTQVRTPDTKMRRVLYFNIIPLIALLFLASQLQPYQSAVCYSFVVVARILSPPLGSTTCDLVRITRDTPSRPNSPVQTQLAIL